MHCPRIVAAWSVGNHLKDSNRRALIKFKVSRTSSRTSSLTVDFAEEYWEPAGRPPFYTVNVITGLSRRSSNVRSSYLGLVPNSELCVLDIAGKSAREHVAVYGGYLIVADIFASRRDQQIRYIKIHRFCSLCFSVLKMCRVGVGILPLLNFWYTSERQRQQNFIAPVCSKELQFSTTRECATAEVTDVMPVPLVHEVTMRFTLYVL